MIAQSSVALLSVSILAVADALAQTRVNPDKGNERVFLYGRMGS